MKKLSFTLVSLLFICVNCTKKNSEKSDFSYQANRIRSNYSALIHGFQQETSKRLGAVVDKSYYCVNFPGYKAFADVKLLFEHAALVHEELIVLRNIFNDPNLNQWGKSDLIIDGAITKPGFIDYTTANSTDGIVNDLVNYPLINMTNLRLWHQKNDPNNRLLGIHAIEYMLWGEDHSTSLPGKRTFDDYYYLTNGQRRTTLLINQCSLLNEDYAALFKKNTSFDAAFAQYDPKKLTALFIDAIALTLEKDIAQKALLTPITTGNQLDELYPFSDLTNKALLAQVKGVGHFIDGSSHFTTQPTDYYLIDLIRENDSKIAEDIERLYSEILGAVSSLGLPFDALISTESGKNTLRPIHSKVLELSDLFKKYKSEYLH